METCKVEGKAEINKYLTERVMPLLQPLQHALLSERPSNLKKFCFEWLKSNEVSLLQKSLKIKSLKQNHTEKMFEEDLMLSGEKKMLPLRREALLGSNDQPSQYLVGKIAAQTLKFSEEKQASILMNLRNSALFQNMKQSDLTEVLQALKEQAYKAGEIIAAEGVEMDSFYLVEEGTFELWEEGRQSLVRAYGAGESINEIGLLYGTKMTTTVKAKTPGRLLVLQAADFKQIIRSQMNRKNNIFQEVYKNIQIFENLTPAQKIRLQENLIIIQAKSGQYLLRQGINNNRFYILIEGYAVMQRKIAEKDETIPIRYLSERSWFGERSLLLGVPSETNVRTLTRCQLLCIDKMAFQRVLGPLQQILNRRSGGERIFLERLEQEQAGLQSYKETSHYYC